MHQQWSRQCNFPRFTRNAIYKTFKSIVYQQIPRDVDTQHQSEIIIEIYWRKQNDKTIDLVAVITGLSLQFLSTNLQAMRPNKYLLRISINL